MGEHIRPYAFIDNKISEGKKLKGDDAHVLSLHLNQKHIM